MARSLANALKIIGVGDDLIGDVEGKQDLNAISQAFGSGGTQQEQLQRLISQNPRAFLQNAPALKSFMELSATGGEGVPSLSSRFDAGATSTPTPQRAVLPPASRKPAEEIFFDSLEEITKEIKAIKRDRKRDIVNEGIEESVADSIVKEELEFLEKQKRGLTDRKASSVVVDPSTGKAAIGIQKTLTTEADEKSAKLRSVKKFRDEIAESERLETFLQTIPNDKARERFAGTEKSKRILDRGVIARAGLDTIVSDNVKAEDTPEKTTIFGDEIGFIRNGKFVAIATKKPGQILKEVVIGNDPETGDPIVATGFITPGVDEDGNVTGGGTFEAITIGGKAVRGIKGGGITVNIEADPQPAAERQELLELKDINEQISDLKALSKPEFVGFLDNIETKIRQGLDISSADRDAFARLLPDIQNQIVFLRSGKAITQGEMVRLLAAMPSITDRDKVFKNKLDDFQRVFQRMFNNRVKALEAQGFRPSVSISEFTPGAIAQPQGIADPDEGLTNDQLDAEINRLRKEVGK